MKHIRLSVVVVVTGSVLMLGSGCATHAYPGGPSVAGIVYTEITSPAQCLAVGLDKDAQPLRKGEASNMAFLGLFAFGNAGMGLCISVL